MRKYTRTAVKLLQGAALVSGFSLLLGYTAIAEAAQGCGQGYHRNGWGRCMLNHPGPWARPAPYHPGCWRNYRGQLRCYRR